MRVFLGILFSLQLSTVAWAFQFPVSKTPTFSPKPPVISPTFDLNPNVFSCGEISFVEFMNGASCSEMANNVFAKTSDHVNRIANMRPVCECLVKENNLPSLTVDPTKAKSEAYDPIAENSHSYSEILTQMRNGMMVQAATLSKDPAVTEALASRYTPNVQTANSIKNPYDFFAAKVNESISEIKSPTGRPAKIDAFPLDADLLSNKPVEGSCLSKLAFINMQKLPDDQTFFDSVKAEKEFDPTRWNINTLMLEFSILTQGKLNLSEALRDQNSKAKEVKARLDFLKKNPLYANLLSIDPKKDPRIKAAQAELFKNFKTVYTTGCNAQKEKPKKCAADKLSHLQDASVKIFNDNFIEAAVNDQALLNFQSVTDFLGSNKDVLQVPFIPESDLASLKDTTIDSYANRLAVCERVKSPNSPVAIKVYSQAAAELNLSWAHELSLEGNMEHNADFQKESKKICHTPKVNSKGESKTLYAYLQEKCRNCSPEDRKKISRDYRHEYFSKREDGSKDTNSDTDIFLNAQEKGELATLKEDASRKIVGKRTLVSADSISNLTTYSSAGADLTSYLAESPAGNQSSSANRAVGFESDFSAKATPVASTSSTPETSSNFDQSASTQVPTLQPFLTPAQASAATSFISPLPAPDTISAPARADIANKREEVHSTESEIQSSDDAERIRELEKKLADLKGQLKKMEDKDEVAKTETVRPVAPQAISAPLANPFPSQQVNNVPSVSSSNVLAPVQNSVAQQVAPSSGSASMSGSANGSSAAASGPSRSIASVKAEGAVAAEAQAGKIYVVSPSSAAKSEVTSSSTPSQDLSIVVSSSEYVLLEKLSSGQPLDQKLSERLSQELKAVPGQKINLSFKSPDGSMLRFDVTKGANGLAFLPVANVRSPAAIQRQNLLNKLRALSTPQ